METQANNTVNETRTIQLTYSEARQLSYLVNRARNEASKEAVLFLTTLSFMEDHVETAKREATKAQEFKTILEKIESIL